MFSNTNFVIPRNVKIFTKRLTNEAIYGGYKSAFKGAGMELQHIRDYEPGDDVRNIDWKSSAKIDKLMIKEFDSERDRVLLLVADFNNTTAYGSGSVFKSDMILNFVVSIANLADACGDRFGFLVPTTSSGPQIYFPPGKGSSQIVRFTNKIMKTFVKPVETNFDSAIEFISKANFCNYVVFFVSDWLKELSVQAMKFFKVCTKKQEVVAVRVLDRTEKAFPEVGMLPIEGFDGKHCMRVNFRNNQINALLKERLEKQNKFFSSLDVDVLDLEPKMRLDRELVSFFRKRMIRK